MLGQGGPLVIRRAERRLGVRRSSSPSSIQTRVEAARRQGRRHSQLEGRGVQWRIQVIEDSEDIDEAIRRVVQLLGVGQLGSRFILDLQARRFTRDQRQAIASRAEELRSKLPDGR